MPENMEERFPAWLVSLQNHESNCRLCGAIIRWGKTKKGKNICVDPYPDGETGQYTAHKATCQPEGG